jgi:ketosteroid isomerase-like protein
MKGESVSPSAVIKEYFDAVNGEHWEHLGSLFTADASYRTTGARPRHGREEIARFFLSLFEPWREHDDAPQLVIAERDAAAVEVFFHGTAQDGRNISFEAVDVFRFRDGKIRSATTWYDVAAVRRMLSGDQA